tara:strand:+ start:119 stop:424 length:306 start_codon:yes stop_codon:yes gene_type:complete
MVKAKRHYESWSIDEARNFITHYLAGIKMNRDVKVVLDQYAAKVQRTYDAISFREKEILSILTGGEKGLGKDKWTKEFIQAVDEKLNDGSISKQKMIMLFE